ncbi:actin-like ATPase domain-containing protein [Gigaspora margarita]|uniref:Actin-like ATPase domain-containing protein n=1 Tax=Gigaspora margarita TaxID=4874 RepID=A0A8H4B1Y9_GIGMA|nr:actin-like ATPase domain-containing protein [Gigaspora margarita]
MDKSDPLKRKTSDGRIKVFKKFVSRGTVVDVDQDFSIDLFSSTEDQTAIVVKIYKTLEYDGRYVDEPWDGKIG